MLYYDGSPIHVGDLVQHATAVAVVESIIEDDEIKRWNLDGPGFMLLCSQCGRVLVDPSGLDWEDVTLIRRA